jgi:hypothetical protein
MSTNNEVVCVRFHSYQSVALSVASSFDVLDLATLSPSGGLGALNDHLGNISESYRFYRLKNLRMRGLLGTSLGGPLADTLAGLGVLAYQPYGVSTPTSVSEVEALASVPVYPTLYHTTGGMRNTFSKWLTLGPQYFSRPTVWRLTDADGSGTQNGYGKMTLNTLTNASTAVYFTFEIEGEVEFNTPVDPDTIAPSMLRAEVHRLQAILRKKEASEPKPVELAPDSGSEADEDGEVPSRPYFDADDALARFRELWENRQNLPQISGPKQGCGKTD